MDKLDFNKNGNVDYSEFLIANLDSQKMLQDDKLKEMFNLFDVDKSGTITAKEIKKILGSGSNSTPNNKNKNEVEECEWDKILMEVDRDGNGEISFEEFKEMIQNMFNIHPQLPDHEQEEKQLSLKK